MAVPDHDASPQGHGKSMTYGEAIAIRRKHPAAVSTKMEASGGSEYEILNCPLIAHHSLFPILGVRENF
jgi:hypothetical protein